MPNSRRSVAREAGGKNESGGAAGNRRVDWETRLALLLEDSAIVCRLETLIIGNGVLLVIVHYVVGLVGFVKVIQVDCTKEENDLIDGFSINLVSE